MFEKINVSERYHIYISELYINDKFIQYDRWIYDRKDKTYTHKDMYGHKFKCKKSVYDLIANCYNNGQKINGMTVVKSYDADLDF